MTVLTQQQINDLQSKITAGNITGFYQDLAGYGDSYAVLGDKVTNNNGWQGQLANGFVNSAANGAMLYGSQAWLDLNKDLAQAYLNAYVTNNNARPTWEAIQTSHNDVYAIHNLPADAWLPNRLLNESSDPGAAWGDYLVNEGAGDIIEDALALAYHNIGAIITPVAVYKMMVDPEGLRAELTFAANLYAGLKALDSAAALDFLDDITYGFAGEMLEKSGQAFDRLKDLLDGFDDLGLNLGGAFSSMRDLYQAAKASNALFSGWGFDPLVFDLDGDGIELTALSGSNAYFNWAGGLTSRQTAWVTGGDGLLVLDANANGSVDGLAELFGNATQTGFEELALHDINEDDKIDALDSVFADLRMWIDANGNGYTDDGELHTLSSLGITEISLLSSAASTTVNSVYF